mgnify:CR=1 FL=1
MVTMEVADEFILKMQKIERWEHDELICEMKGTDEDDKQKLKNEYNSRMRKGNLLISYLYTLAFDKPMMKSVGVMTDPNMGLKG